MRNNLTLLDGGFGTMAQAAGLATGADPTDWNIERPEAVTAIHRAYVEAGSNIVLTNTFGANRLKYHGRHALASIVSAGVTAARQARAGRVALDIGPTGKLLKPAGDLSFDAAVEAFGETIRVGAAAGADLVFIETMGDLHELKAAVVAAKENAALPIYASVALGEGGKLLTGSSVTGVCLMLEALGVDAYGLNCGLGPDEMLPYFKEMAAIATKPLIAKPNAGLPRIENGQTVFDVGPDAFANSVRKLIAAGAAIVGGCCGTTPAYIRRLS